MPIRSMPSHRAIQWQFCFRRTGNRHRLCRLPGRRAEPIQPEPAQPLLCAEQIRRPLRPGQLARSPEPYAELRTSLGPHRALVGEVQPDLDLCCRRTVGRLSRRACGHSLSWRSRASPIRSRRSSNLSFSPRVGWPGRRRAEDGSFLGKFLGAPGATSVRASFGNFYTAIDALPSVCWRRTLRMARLIPARPLRSLPRRSSPLPTAQNNGQPFPYTFAPLNSSRRNPDPNIDWCHIRAHQRHPWIRHS